MPPRVLTALVCSAAILAGASSGELHGQVAGAPARALEKKLPSLSSEPMTITSDRMTFHEAEQRATFEGQVVVRQGDLTVKADRLDVWVNGSVTTRGPVYGGSTISSIKATGRVEVAHGDRLVRADEATYDQARQQIELVGNLVGEEGGYRAAGTRMIIYLQERRSVIEGSHVIIPPGFTSSPAGTAVPGAERADPSAAAKP
jgi:lipopolysaccharide export system protein LptA